MTDLRKAAEMAFEAMDKPFDSWQSWIHDMKQAKEALRQALAQPSDSVEQEPVAYLDEGLGTFYWANDYEKDVGFTPLYTAPPKREWVGLTDEEYLEVCKIAENGNYLTAFRQITNKLKEKNT